MITTFVLNAIIAMCTPLTSNHQFVNCIQWMADCTSQRVMNAPWTTQRQRDNFILEYCSEKLPEELWPR